jgi:hypothetical protein
MILSPAPEGALALMSRAVGSCCSRVMKEESRYGVRISRELSLMILGGGEVNGV